MTKINGSKQEVEVPIPLRQGLKPYEKGLTPDTELNVEVPIPLRQGLKHLCFFVTLGVYNNVEVPIPLRQGSYLALLR